MNLAEAMAVAGMAALSVPRMVMTGMIVAGVIMIMIMVVVVTMAGRRSHATPLL